MPQLARFAPHDWQWAPWLDRNETLLLSGKPGGGKSYLAANKIHGFLLQYPHTTAIVARKVKEDMDQSTIPMFLNEIIDIDNEPRCTYQARRERIVYQHPNGQISELLFKGMNTPRQRESWKSAGMKGDIDIIWLEEATEFDEEDYNYCLMRLRGDAAGWQQIILTTNPDARMHWIHVRLIMGEEAAYYYSDWTMNPSLNREKYTATMSKVTGITRARMWSGEWTDGIGRVIDTWQDNYNRLSNANPLTGNVLVEADYIPGGGEVVWAVDDGYAGTRDKKTGYFTSKSNPRTFLLCQKRPNDQLAIFAEHMEVKSMYEPHIMRVLDTCQKNNWPKPVYVVYDNASPTLGRYLTQFGLNAIGFKTKIKAGNDELINWVGADSNGQRRYIVHPRCKQTRWEYVSYVYDPKKENTPVDSYNHTIDASRYLTTFISFGEPQQVDIAAPGVDMEDIHKRVKEAMDSAYAENADKIREFMTKAGI